MDLNYQITSLDLLDGILGIIYPIIGIFVGLTISSKYAKHKRPELLYVGIALSLYTFSWMARGIAFVTFAFYDQPLEPHLFLLLAFGFGGIAVFSWMNAMSILLYKNSKKKIMIVFSLICIPYQIFLFVFVFIEPSLVGTAVSPLSLRPSLITAGAGLFFLVVLLTTMFVFVKECLKAGDLKVMWRGRFLLIFMILFVVISLLNVTMSTILIVGLIATILSIIQLFFSYLGWILPERVAQWLIKEKS